MEEEEEDGIEEGKDGALSSLLGIIRLLNKSFLRSNNSDKSLKLLLELTKRGSELEEAIRID